MENTLDAFAQLEGIQLKNVQHGSEYGMLTTLILDFGSTTLLLKAKEEDDSLEVSRSESPYQEQLELEKANEELPWRSVIGKSFGWGWITINQQGYRDGALLSFEGIVPQIVIYVLASSLQIGSINMEQY